MRVLPESVQAAKFIFIISSTEGLRARDSVRRRDRVVDVHSEATTHTFRQLCVDYR